jgi:hypothetical protein
MSTKAIYHDNFEAIFIYQAETRGGAIAAVLLSARDAGYKPEWGDFKARRALCFDALVQASGGCFALGYHARAYDLSGNFTGYNQSGCLDGQRQHPRTLYATIQGGRV